MHPHFRDVLILLPAFAFSINYCFTKTTLIAFTRAWTFSPSEKPASCKLSRVITDVSLGASPAQPPTHMVTWAMISSVLILSISPIKLFLTPASKRSPPIKIKIKLLLNSLLSFSPEYFNYSTISFETAEIRI